jgi:hypothetical protein
VLATSAVLSEVFDDGTLMIMEIRLGFVMLILRVYISAIFISFDFADWRPAARLAALTTYAAPDAAANPKIFDFL